MSLLRGRTAPPSGQSALHGQVQKVNVFTLQQRTELAGNLHCISRQDAGRESGQSRTLPHLNISHTEDFHELGEDGRIRLDGAPRVAHAACARQRGRCQFKPSLPLHS